MTNLTVKLSLSAIAHGLSRQNRKMGYECEHYGETRNEQVNIAAKYHARANEFQAWYSFMLALGE